MDGYKEHWYCSECQKYFTDPYGAIEVPESEIILRSGDGIPFLDKDGDVFKVYYAYNATKITESSDYLGAPGFYYVDGNVTINEHCRWNEDVKLILCDGATLYIGDEQKAVHHYTVRDYCEVILSPEYAASFSETSYTYNKLATLVKTMLNYGAMSQTYFKHNTDNLANHDIGYDLTPLDQEAIYSLANDLPKRSDFDEKLAPYGVKYYGCSLLLRSKTTMRFYFEKTGTGTFSADNFYINGEKAEVKEYQDGSRYVYIEVADIPSPDLGTAYSITVGSGEDDVFIGYISPLSYVKDVLLDATASEDLKNVVTALDRYYQAAHELFH